MSFFNFRKKKAEEKKPAGRPSVKPAAKAALAPKAAPPTALVKTSVHTPEGARVGLVLVRPRVTEKSADGNARGVYVFEVTRMATKHSIARAIALLYHVYPRKVALAAIPRKRVTVRGKTGMKGGGKKAYVYLKKGEKIEII